VGWKNIVSQSEMRCSRLDDRTGVEDSKQNGFVGKRYTSTTMTGRRRPGKEQGGEGVRHCVEILLVRRRWVSIIIGKGRDLGKRRAERARASGSGE
jgi:hypothetical protein